MTNLQRFLANEPGLSTTGVREELLGLMGDYQKALEALGNCIESGIDWWLCDEAKSELLEHGVTDYELQETLTSLAQKYEWFKEVV